MELRPTNKILQDSINTPVRTFGFSAIEFFSLSIGIVLLGVMLFFMIHPLAVALMVPVMYGFGKVSAFLKESQGRGIDRPLIARLIWRSVPKKMTQNSIIPKVWK